MKNWLTKIIIYFVAAVLALVFISRLISTLMMPEVVVQSVQSDGTLTQPMMAVGFVMAGGEPEKITFPQTMEVDEVSVRVGDEVKKGDVLFTMNQSEFEKAQLFLEGSILNAELSVKQMERQLKDMAKMRSDDKELLLAQAENALAQAKLTLEGLRAEKADLKETGRTVVSPAQGTVSVVNVRNGDTLLAGMPVMEIIPQSGGMNIQFSVPKDFEAMLTEKAQVNFSTSDKALVNKTLIVTEVKAENNMLTVTAEPQISGEDLLKLRMGELVNIRKEWTVGSGQLVYMQGIVEEMDVKYVFVLNTRKGFFGSELYVSKQIITVTEDNGMQALMANAGMATGQRYVVSSSKGLEDGQRVKLK